MDEIVMAVGGVLALWFVQHTVHICTHSQACTCTALVHVCTLSILQMYMYNRNFVCVSVRVSVLHVSVVCLRVCAMFRCKCSRALCLPSLWEVYQWLF